MSQSNDVFEKAASATEVSAMQELRDAFLDSLLQRFPELDLEEIYEILREFKEPFLLLAQ